MYWDPYGLQRVLPSEGKRHVPSSPAKCSLQGVWGRRDLGEGPDDKSLLKGLHPLGMPTTSLQSFTSSTPCSFETPKPPTITALINSLCCSSSLLEATHSFQQRKGEKEGEEAERELWAILRASLSLVAITEGKTATPCSGRDGVKAETKRQLPGNFLIVVLIKAIPLHRVSTKRI